MMTDEAMQTAKFNDAALVAETLAGNREAFRRIVERYQTLISSLAYCATGNVSQSEDLAQETFVTAWKQLSDLREPAKLRPWLCGIARFLISKEFRRQGHEPLHAAESLEAVDEWISPEPLPPDHVISAEEKAILWRSLERIPQIYREPLVLFYREHQSIETVAQNLDLSEDVVKQRLSRGRKLLHEQVLAFVEAALDRTKPDKAFTLGVLAALPLVATTVKAATASVALKGGSSVKVATSLAMLGAILTAGILFNFSLMGFFVFTGSCVGFMMGRTAFRSARELKNVIRFWRLLAAGFLGIVAPMLLLSDLISKPALYHTYFQGMTWWLRLIYPLVLTALAIWIGRWWHGLRHRETEVESSKPTRKSFAVWFALGLIVPALLCVNLFYAMLFRQTWTTQFLSAAEAQKIIAGRKDAIVRVEEYASGAKMLWIKLPENGRRVEYFTPADATTLAVLAKSGIPYKTLVEGRDFIQEGITWHGLVLLSLFVTATGVVMLMHRPWKRESFSQRAVEIQRDERAAKRAFKALATAIALVMLTAGVLLGLITRWTAHTISDAEAQKIIANFKDARFEVFQYDNGKKELWISKQRHPDFIAPADNATLSLLAKKGIAYKTYVQGRDFGYATPNRTMSLIFTSILVVGAGIILWWVTPKTIAVILALAMIAGSVLLGLMTIWHARSLSSAEAQKMITERPNARFEIFQYASGAQELWITPRRSKHHPAFIAPADHSTLALLADHKIAYRTFIQGGDFGYGMLRRGASLFWISLLTLGSVSLLWWTVKKGKTVSAPVG